MKEVDKKSYELIAEEIDTGDTQKALWTKAFSDAEGDESRTKALYIKYRFKEISNEEQEYHEDEWDDDEDFKTTTGLAKDGYQFNKDKQIDAGIPRAEKSSNSVNSIHSAKEHTGENGGIKIGGFLYVVCFVLLMATYKWIQIFSWEFNEGRVEGNHPNLAIILLFLAILVNLYLLYKFFSKKISFVTNFLWLSSLKLAVIIIYFNDKILEVEMLGKTSSHPSPWPEAWLWVYLFYLVSAIYLLVSKRVKQTFVN